MVHMFRSARTHFIANRVGMARDMEKGGQGKKEERNQRKNQSPRKTTHFKIGKLFAYCVYGKFVGIPHPKENFLCAHYLVLSESFPFRFFMFFASHVLDHSQMTKSKVHNMIHMCLLLFNCFRTKRNRLINNANVLLSHICYCWCRWRFPLCKWIGTKLINWNDSGFGRFICYVINTSVDFHLFRELLG